jgi:hypothetical protein
MILTKIAKGFSGSGKISGYVVYVYHSYHCKICVSCPLWIAPLNHRTIESSNRRIIEQSNHQTVEQSKPTAP